MELSSLLWSTLPATLLYLTCLLASYRSLYRPGRESTVHLVLWISVVYHWLVTLGYTWFRGHLPIDNFAEVLLTNALATASLQLVIGHKTPQLRMITLLPVLASLLGAFALGGLGWQSELNGDWFFRGHLVMSMAAVSAWSISATLSLMFLLLDFRLRRKQFDPLFHHLPPIQELEKQTQRWNGLGLLLGLSAVILGLIWKETSPFESDWSSMMASYGPFVLFFLVWIAGYFHIWNPRKLAWMLLSSTALLALSILVKAV